MQTHVELVIPGCLAHLYWTIQYMKNEVDSMTLHFCVSKESKELTFATLIADSVRIFPRCQRLPLISSSQPATPRQLLDAYRKTRLPQVFQDKNVYKYINLHTVVYLQPLMTPRVPRHILQLDQDAFSMDLLPVLKSYHIVLRRYSPQTVARQQLSLALNAVMAVGRFTGVCVWLDHYQVPQIILWAPWSDPDPRVWSRYPQLHCFVNLEHTLKERVAQVRQWIKSE